MIKKYIRIVGLVLLLILSVFNGSVNVKDTNCFITKQQRYTLHGNALEQPYWLYALLIVSFLWIGYICVKEKHSIVE